MPYKLPNDKYPYPLNHLASDGGTVDTVFISNDPTVLVDSTNWYVLCLTPTELKNLISVIEVGAPIAFPDSYNTITQKYMQMREFPNEIPGDSCMDLCALILACIEDTPAIQQSIAFYGHGASITETTPEQQEILDLDVFLDQSPCDNDEIYGMALQMADLLNTVSEDILELFVTAFAAPGRLGDLIEAIPIIGELPGDDILQILEKLAEQVNDAYQAAYDQQIREDVSCALFCLAIDTCELTLEDARDYFEGLLSASVNNTDFLTVANDIIANNWLGEQSIWVMHWLILDTMIFGGEMLGIDADRLATTIATYFNDPNSDWEFLCTDCSDVYFLELDATVSQGGIILDAGTWTTAIGFREIDTANLSRCFLRYEAVGSYDCQFIEFVSTKTPVTTTGFRQLRLSSDVGEEDVRLVVSGAQQPTPTAFGLTTDVKDITRFQWRQDSSTQNSNMVVSRLRLKLISAVIPQELLDDGWTTYTP